MRLQNLTKTWGLKGNLKINHLKKDTVRRMVSHKM
jgi:hypothetical protein